MLGKFRPLGSSRGDAGGGVSAILQPRSADSGNRGHLQSRDDWISDDVLDHDVDHREERRPVCLVLVRLRSFLIWVMDIYAVAQVVSAVVVVADESSSGERPLALFASTHRDRERER